MGRPAHPLLGNPTRGSQAVLESRLGFAGLELSGGPSDQQFDRFSGAGYVEMALAAAREVFGPAPCVLEDIEFQRFLVLDPSVTPVVQVEFDPASNEFAVAVRGDDSDDSWEVNAKGSIRQFTQSTPDKLDLTQIVLRCPASFSREECNRRFADAGYHYGPTFQGIERLWRGEREVLAEVLVPAASTTTCPTIDCIPPFSTPVFKRCWRPFRPGPRDRSRKAKSSCR